jgi:hypothetical protein
MKLKNDYESIILLEKEIEKLNDNFENNVLIFSKVYALFDKIEINEISENHKQILFKLVFPNSYEFLLYLQKNEKLLLQMANYFKPSYYKDLVKNNPEYFNNRVKANRVVKILYRLNSSEENFIELTNQLIRWGIEFEFINLLGQIFNHFVTIDFPIQGDYFFNIKKNKKRTFSLSEFLDTYNSLSEENRKVKISHEFFYKLRVLIQNYKALKKKKECEKDFNYIYKNGQILYTKAFKENVK